MNAIAHQIASPSFNLSDDKVQSTMPANINAQLRAKIDEWRSAVPGKRKRSYHELHTALSEHVNQIFESKRAELALHDFNERDFDNEVKKHIPNLTYLKEFGNGASLCQRFTNSIANFFQVTYCVSNFNPADDLLLEMNHQGKTAKH